MLRLWGIVLAANVVGCFLFGCAFALLPMLGEHVTGEMAKLVENLMRNSPWEMFAKGIGAGWLIAAVVWIIASVSSGEFLVIGLLTYLIALFQFTHIVPGTAEALYGWVAGLITFYDASIRFFLPTLAGNVFGGTILFSVSAMDKCERRSSRSRNCETRVKGRRVTGNTATCAAWCG